MAKREQGNEGGVEGRMEEFAEDLGRLLGAAQAKAEGWLGQRKAVAEQLTQIRDTAAALLTQLTGNGANIMAAVQRGRRRGRPPGRSTASDSAAVTQGPRKRRRMSTAARKAISDAQKARWARQRAGDRKK
jgi:hypothetical protein